MSDSKKTPTVLYVRSGYQVDVMRTDGSVVGKVVRRTMWVPVLPDGTELPAHDTQVTAVHALQEDA